MDRTDYAIIDHLKLNARANYGDIGDDVGLSASAVKRRIDKLVDSGVITGFTVQIDPKIEGLRTEAYVELFCRGTVSPPELKEILSAVPDIVEAYTVTGDADAVVIVRARDPHSLEDALERIRAAKSVDRTRSALILSRLVQRNGM